MKLKEESEKTGLKPVKNAGLKLCIKKKKVGHANQFHHFMANRWEMETVTDFIFLGSTITADGDCSHEIKRCLLIGRKAMTNLGSIL